MTLLLHEVVAKHSRHKPHDIAWSFESSSRSWSDAHERIVTISSNLLRLGLQVGERVAVYGDNSADVAEMFIALGRVGLVAVPINPRAVQNEVAYACADVQARCIVVTSRHASVLRNGNPEWLTQMPLVIGLGTDHDCPIGIDDLLQPTRSAPPVDDLDAIRVIKYTSGTTGQPKGCVSTHRQFLKSVGVYLCTVPFNQDDRALLALPLTAGVGMYLFSAYMCAGIPTVIHARFDASEFLRTIEASRITRFYAMPTMLGALVQSQEAHRKDVSSLRLVGYGGSPAAVHLVQRAASTLECGFYQTFGSSEAGGFVTCLRPEQHARLIASSRGTSSAFGDAVMPCGSEVDGIELRIVADDGSDAEPGSPGEMWIRSDSLMSGYWRRPEDTSRTLVEGWLVSGDVVVRDSDGFISVIDRKRDMIISGGYNIYSSEVEAVMQRHPAVAEAAVVGVPDPYWGETVVAFIRLSPKAACNESELLGFANKELAGYKRPRAVFLLHEMPKTSTGKIRKNVLREQAQRLWPVKGNS